MFLGTETGGGKAGGGGFFKMMLSMLMPALNMDVGNLNMLHTTIKSLE